MAIKRIGLVLRHEASFNITLGVLRQQLTTDGEFSERIANLVMLPQRGLSLASLCYNRLRAFTSLNHVFGTYFCRVGFSRTRRRRIVQVSDGFLDER
jgi:hypothetical protein